MTNRAIVSAASAARRGHGILHMTGTSSYAMQSLWARHCGYTVSSSNRYLGCSAMHTSRLMLSSINKPTHNLLQATLVTQLPVHSMVQRRSMFIQTEATPNMDSLKFKPGRAVMPQGTTSTAEFISIREALASPLASSLFRIDGVKSVLFGADTITVNKSAEIGWQLIKPDIFGAIMDFYSAGTPLFKEKFQGATDTMILPEDSETVAMIKELLESRIRPTIQEDGGDIEYMGFVNGAVKLKLRGACRTCDSSVVTLKNGIQNMLMHYIPEVTAVEQVLDEMDVISNKEFSMLEASLQNKQHIRIKPM